MSEEQRVHLFPYCEAKGGSEIPNNDNVSPLPLGGRGLG